MPGDALLQETLVLRFSVERNCREEGDQENDADGAVDVTRMNRQREGNEATIGFQLVIFQSSAKKSAFAA